jgi:predicted nucleic-acid-binding protein
VITAVDTNVLLALLVPGGQHGGESQQALDEAVVAGPLVISEPVYAELVARFLTASDLDLFLASTGLVLQPQLGS